MLIGPVKQLPDRINDIRTVRVNKQIFCFLKMPGDMNITDSLSRQLRKKCIGIVAMVNAVDINIINIQQKIAIRLGQYRIEKVDLRHFLTRCRIVRHILHRDAS